MLRFQVVRTTSSLMTRTLCLSYRSLQEKVPDMAEGNSHLFVSNGTKLVDLSQAATTANFRGEEGVHVSRLFRASGLDQKGLLLGDETNKEQYSVPITALGHWAYMTRGKITPYWPTNTTSSSNLVFFRRFPIQKQTKRDRGSIHELEAMAERVTLSSQLANSQDELPVKRMKDSYIKVHLPLGTQPKLREKYLTYHNSVRFGRILEDLDSIAGENGRANGLSILNINDVVGPVLICYSHTKNDALPQSPLSIVTALVDKIDMRKQIIYPDCDLKFIGHVTWVGKTSMEAKIHVSQFHDGAFSPVLDATFVMVARDPENKRAAYVNPLKPDGLEEEKLFQQGEANKKRRVELGTTSLLKVAPTAEERKIIHSLFLNTLDSKTVSFRSRVLPPNSVWMEDAKVKGLEICHPQERNIFNRIFGGFLMRKSYELAWANACGYGGCRPHLVAVDDILFQKPVEIGSLLLLSSQVCYTWNNYIQVRVHTEVLDPLTGQHNTTNIFHFTFSSPVDVRAIMPKSYGESMLYLDGKRHFDVTMSSQ